MIGWVGLVIDLWRMVYRHKWSAVSYKWSTGRGKFAGQRSTLYHCAVPRYQEHTFLKHHSNNYLLPASRSTHSRYTAIYCVSQQTGLEDWGNTVCLKNDNKCTGMLHNVRRKTWHWLSVSTCWRSSSSLCCSSSRLCCSSAIACCSLSSSALFDSSANLCSSASRARSSSSSRLALSSSSSLQQSH